MAMTGSIWGVIPSEAGAEEVEGGEAEKDGTGGTIVDSGGGDRDGGGIRIPYRRLVAVEELVEVVEARVGETAARTEAAMNT